MLKKTLQSVAALQDANGQTGQLVCCCCLPPQSFGFKLGACQLKSANPVLWSFFSLRKRSLIKLLLYHFTLPFLPPCNPKRLSWKGFFFWQFSWCTIAISFWPVGSHFLIPVYSLVLSLVQLCDRLLILLHSFHVFAAVWSNQFSNAVNEINLQHCMPNTCILGLRRSQILHGFHPCGL